MLTGNYSDTTCYLLRLDRQGEVSWMKRYTGLGNPEGGSGPYPCSLNKFYDVTVAADGNLIVVGTTNGILSAQRSILCFDSLGTWLWGQTSGVEQHNESLMHAATGNDNTFIVAGSSPDLFGDRATLFRYALEDGASLGGVEMLGGLGTQPMGIDFSADGNILMTTGQFGCQMIKMTPGFVPIWRRSWANFCPKLIRGQTNGLTVAASDTVIAVINPSGALAWIKALHVEGVVQDIAVRPDGHILALGQVGNAYSWLARIDSTGEIQWIRRYGNDGEDIALNDIRLLPDGSAFLVGYNPVTDVIWLVSIDQNGGIGDCSFPALSAETAPFTAVPSDTLTTFNWSPGAPGELQEIDTTAAISVEVTCGPVGY